MKKTIFYTLPVLLLMISQGCSNSAEQHAKNDTNDIIAIRPVKGLTGQSYQPVMNKGSKEDSLYRVAVNQLRSDSSEYNMIWAGRRKAYLQHYHEAIGIFSEGIEKYPDSYRLYRHRGHRYISIRDFEQAERDLQKAANIAAKTDFEIEEDGIPNKLNIPLSNTHFNIYYHLGLAQYLQAKYEDAANTYEKCLVYSNNDDLYCATADWLYMTYNRLGKTETAQKLLEKVTEEMEIVENASYHKRLLMYKGIMEPEDLLVLNETEEDYALSLATQGYGVGNYYLITGDTAKALATFERVLGGDHWAAFGFIASEADMHRLAQ